MTTLREQAEDYATHEDGHTVFLAGAKAALEAVKAELVADLADEEGLARVVMEDDIDALVKEVGDE